MAILRTKNGNILGATFFFFKQKKNPVEDWHKTGMLSWNFPAQEDIFFSFFSCSPVVSLTCDLPHGSAGLCWCRRGLQVKPRFHQDRRRWTEATLRSWLNDKTSFFFLSPTRGVFSSTCKETALCFFIVIASVVVCHLLTRVLFLAESLL